MKILGNSGSTTDPDPVLTAGSSTTLNLPGEHHTPPQAKVTAGSQ